MYPITRKEKLADRIFLMDVKDTVFRDSLSSRRSTRQESESP